MNALRRTFPHLIALCVVAIVLGACNGPKNTATTTSYGGPGPADSLFFTLTKTPCFGKCPAYSISVFRSGYATYVGKSHVEKTGDHKGRIGPDTLALLLAKAEAIGFFDLEDRYDSEVTDLPSTIINVVADGRNKKVTARHQVPPRFKELAAYAESLLLPVAWKPVGGQY